MLALGLTLLGLELSTTVVSLSVGRLSSGFSAVANGLEFERGVRWAASEVVALLDAGRRVALRTDAAYLAADAGAGQRARLLSFLARVAPGSAARAEGA